MNISKVIYWAERRYGDNTALIYNDSEISFHKLRENTEKYIHYFSLLDLDRKKPIAVSLPNIPEFIYITMALNSLGIPVILTNTAISSMELSYILEDSGAEMLISYRIPEDYARRVSALAAHSGKNIKFIDIREPSVMDPGSLLTDYIERLEPKKVFIPLKDPCSSVIIYTSGEEGYLMGASLSYSNLMSNILVTREYMSLTMNDVLFSLLPFYHAFGFSNTLLTGLLEGSKQLLIDRYRTSQILEFIQKYRITRIQSVPMMFYTIFNHRHIDRYDISSLKKCISGGSPMDAEFQKYVNEKYQIGIHQGFGITEASAAVTFNFLDEDIVYGSCGKILPIFKSKIVDETGRVLRAGETGEMHIKGPSITDRYIGRFSDCRDRFAEDGWFKTGDYFMIDKEGNHFFKGLKKNMYLVGGYNVYPREVERIIAMIEGVEKARVYSAEKDSKGNYIISADITIKGSAEKEGIFREICTLLSPYKIPSRIEWIVKND